MKRFQVVAVPETTVDEAIRMLKDVRPRYERHHELRYADEALVAAAELSNQYINNQPLPDKAIELIDDAGARVRLRHDRVRVMSTVIFFFLCFIIVIVISINQVFPCC